MTADEIKSAFTLSDQVVLMVKLNLKMKSKLSKVHPYSMSFIYRLIFIYICTSM